MRDKALLRRVLAVHERVCPIAEEWDAVNREFVLDREFPFVDRESAASASSGERGCAHGYPLASRAFRDQPRFRKLLRNPVVFRLGQAVAYGIPEAGLKETLEHFMRGK